VLELTVERLLAPGLNVDHPRFFGYVPPPNDLVAAFADALASGFDVFAGTWQASPGAALAELQVLDWLRALCGMPPETAGVLLSGGSMANFTALVVALHERAVSDRLNASLYASAESHSSVERAARALGVRLILVPEDEERRMSLAALHEAVAADCAAGHHPWCVAATAGTTSTGAVDPLPELRELCDAEGLWLHVDAASGAAAALTDAGRELLEGLDAADSVTVDPHKWLFQPLELGCVLIRDGEGLARTFAVTPPYLRDAAVHEAAEVNFVDRSLELSRRSRALKLWFSLHVRGVAAFRDAVRHGLELAEHAERRLRAMPGWEVVTPARLAVVTFRATPPGRSMSQLDALAREIAAGLEAGGSAYLSTTEVAGRTVLRMCTINPRTTHADIDATLAEMDRIATA
jgi:aromatic-L-amino-acid/L-tryptophan decarboxylase